MSTGQGTGDGGTGEGGSGGAGGSGDGGGTGGGTKEQTFTQADLTRVGTREKQEGHKAGRSQALKDLGVENEEEAKELLAEAKAAREAKKSQADKDAEKARNEAAQATREKEEAAREKLNTRIERQLMLHGLSLDKDPDKADKQLARASRLLDLDTTADVDAIKQAVKDLKDEMPSLFAETDDDEEDDEDEDPKTRRTQNRNGSGNDPGRPPKTKKQQGTSQERANARLRERHPHLAKDK